MITNRGTINFPDLDAALDRCMKEHPPTGKERTLHPDASRMAGLWADMLLSQDQSRQWQGVDERVFVAFQTWSAAQ